MTSDSRPRQPPRPPQREPTAQQPIALGRHLAMTYRATRRVIERPLTSHGATLSAVHIGRALVDEPGLSQRALADRLDITGPSLIRHLDRMEAEGLLVREPDPSDRRARRLFLTDAGAAALDRLEQMSERAEADLTAGLTPAEVETLTSLLARVHERARELL